MIELGLQGSRRYWFWIFGLFAIIAVGGAFYYDQLKFGLMVTGQSRDVSWGFYTAQMTFFVGVAAGGVMLILPYYLHYYKKFGRITILGEFLAAASIIMCLLFVVVHLGQPMRILNVFLYPTPGSMLFWDANVLSGYLVLNIIIGWKVLEAEYNGTALLILVCKVIQKVTKFNPGDEAIQTLAKIVTYALIANVFFLLCEVFVVFYSGIPGHTDHIRYLYLGLHGHNAMVPWMWSSVFLMLTAIMLLLIPQTRKNEITLILSCIFIFCGTWIDKGLGMMAGGFIPSPLHRITEYTPSIHELLISAGIAAIGMLVLTLLYKITIRVKEYSESGLQ